MSGGPVPVWKKYTSRPTGIWEKIRQALVLVPNRSSGNPLVQYFRAIPPGSRIKQANEYKDPVTLPTGDIKGNPYYKRDYRRNYPQVHGFDQTKVSGLLKVGSAEKPRILIGDKGTNELAAFGAGQRVGLASTLALVDVGVLKGEVLGAQGEPVVAPSMHKFMWKILEEPQHGMYTDEYPCRTFTSERV
ncbi:hypothetical protein PUMCH_001563 [Australozyma saopauloensis]|uniref:NADH-ubiquinone oxidoreductase subunit n=1 Tax=Australozyma saopauloensis TaxID=291208 RepID=A0AAX4H6V4_9ASCO|nr:hypothetical protein PUMCH_001563 [[Candida] saopauloensis]